MMMPVTEPTLIRIAVDGMRCADGVANLCGA